MIRARSRGSPELSSAGGFGSLCRMVASVEIFDRPTPAQLATLTKPAFAAILTDKNGIVVKVEISKESGGFVYARTTEAPTIYKLKPQVVADLNFKLADLMP